MGSEGRDRIRLALASLEHDHAWWTIDHILAESAAQLVALADPRPHLVEKARTKGYPGLRLFSSVEEMLDREKPDALIVTAANNEHRALVEACAARRIDCMVQKPMATTAADARAMEKAARESGIRLMVNCFPFWKPEFQEMSRRLAEGELGPIQKMVTHNGHQGPLGIGVLTKDYLGWLYDPLRHGGGAFIDQGSYGLAYTLMALGKPQTVYSLMHTFKPDENRVVEDDAVAVLGFDKATAVVQGSFIWPFGRTEIQAYGPRGGLRIVNERLWKEEAYSASKPQEKVSFEIVAAVPPPERKNGIAHFVDCLRTGKAFDYAQGPEINVMVAEAVDAAYDSFRSGLPTRL